MKQRHIYIVMAAMLALTACSDDYFNNDVEHEFSEYIGYSVSVKGSDEFQSRAGVVNGRHITIEPVGESLGGRPLYLHTEVLDSIPQSVTRAKNGTAPLSRGTVTYTSGLESINISAVVFDGEKDSWPSGSATAQMYMHNETVSAPSWNTNRYWPKENDWIRFYAYAPCDALSLGEISAAEPSFDYTVAGTIPDQVDLLVGSEQYTGWKCETAQLDMGHALTAVKIHIDGNVSDFTLTSLKISGLKDSGTYTYDYNESTVGDGDQTTQTHDAGTWSNLAGEAAYTVYEDEAGMSLTKIENDGNGTSLIDPETGKSVGYTDMTAGNMVLFMMPQVLPDNAKITITGTDKVLNEDVILSAVIGDGTKEWVKGTMVTYTISFSSTKIEYYLEVTPSSTVPFYGGYNDFNVLSYKIVTRSGATSEKIAVPWEIDQNAAGKPDWIDEFPKWQGIGSTDKGETATYGALASLDRGASLERSSVKRFDTYSSLEQHKPKGTASVPYDLSTEGGTKSRSTANSYVVSAPGYYSLPLVYGNSITEDITNNPAFAPGVPSQNPNPATADALAEDGTTVSKADVSVAVFCLQNFKDHAGNAISQPWISAVYTPDSAQIVWQDEPCLLTDVKLNATKDYLLFRVHEDMICEGNAVVAVKDATGTIIWSWHIWVTDYWQEYDAEENGWSFSPYDDPASVPRIRKVVSRRMTDGWDDIAANGHYIESDFSILNVPIGHCDAELKNYIERTATINIVQKDTNEPVGTPLAATHTITQESAKVEMKDNATYYQYGRPVPMLPTNGVLVGGKVYEDKPYYTHKRERVTDYSAGVKTVGRGIKVGFNNGQAATLTEALKNPGVFYSLPSGRDDGSGDYKMYNSWYVVSTDMPYYNLWNGKNQYLPMFSYPSSLTSQGFHNNLSEMIGVNVTKTVYDPCPPGFELPRVDAFLGFSYYGSNIHPLTSAISAARVPTLVDHANMFVPGNFDFPYNAAYMFCETMDALGVRGDPSLANNGPGLYLQLLGHRQYTGKVEEYHNFGNALTCAPISVQWGVLDVANKYFQIELGRLCLIRNTVKATGQEGSLRVLSSSAFDLAFPIMPAVTNRNPYNSVSTTTIGDNINWSGDGNDNGEQDDGGYNVDF